MALNAQAAAFVYIYVRIPQIARMILSFYATIHAYEMYVYEISPMKCTSIRYTPVKYTLMRHPPIRHSSIIT
jgi:hypothetical protein